MTGTTSSKKAAGSPLAVLAPLAIIAGAGFFIFKHFKGDSDEDKKEKKAKEGSRLSIPNRLAESDHLDSPGDFHFHDATADLDAESPRVSSASSKSNGHAVGQDQSDDEHEFAEAETGPTDGDEIKGEEDSSAQAELDALMLRAQGTHEKLLKLESNLSKS